MQNAKLSDQMEKKPGDVSVGLGVLNKSVSISRLLNALTDAIGLQDRFSIRFSSG